MAKVAFIGLGVMGAPIAGHLAAAGHALTVYNRSPAKAEAWVAKHGGAMATTVQQAARDQDVVISCVGNDDDLASVTLGQQGAFRVMKPGAIFIDHTTVSARIARQLAVEAKDFGLHSIDAPVTGSQSGAENGTLSIMCGALPKAFAAGEPYMRSYSKRIVHVGRPGAGQTTKMVNQIALVAAVQGLAEAVRFAQAAHLDLDKVFEAISGGAASSWQMLNRWKTMADDEFEFGLAVDWMRKDLGLTLEEARTNGASLPIAALCDQFYAEVQAMGHGKLDTSAIVKRLPK